KYSRCWSGSVARIVIKSGAPLRGRALGHRLRGLIRRVITRLAVQQRQNGSHSEREPCQNEYDSAGWRRHGKYVVADESAKGNVASKQCAAKHPPAKHTEHQRPQQQTLL